jgi:hypothetical protein
MSSSSDIEKLFEQFGGDANAYQEIGRENDARTARTRWPLLVTLDLTQPAIPEIGQLREAKPQPSASAASVAASPEDSTPKDVAAVTRAKAPLFTRSHRRDIPPVAVAPEKPPIPSGASRRFGAAGQPDQDGEQAASRAEHTAAPAQAGDAAAAATGAPVAPAAASAAAPAFAGTTAMAPIPPAVSPAPAFAAAPVAASIPPAIVSAGMPAFAAAPAAAPTLPAMASTPMPPISPIAAPARIPPTPPATAPAWFASGTLPVGSIPPGNPSSAFQFRAPPAQPAPSAAAAWAGATAAARVSTNSAPIASIAPASSMQPTQPMQPAQPPSILGKLFARTSSAPPQPAAAGRESIPLQSVFDRLRGTPAQNAATPAGTSGSAAQGTFNSWLINGPRRS